MPRPTRYSAELRERVVRMVVEQRDERLCEWATGFLSHRELLQKA
jgi:transposase-like protein